MIEAINALKAEGRFAEANALIPYTAFIGLEIAMQSGELLSLLRSRESNTGNTQLPAIHGGVVGAALEHAAIIELLFRLELEAMPRVINISIDYLRPVRVQDLWLRGYIVRQGRRIANVRCEAWQENRERLVAASHAHFKLS